jgi:L-threonylcarbamoyladenylate synthase
MTLSRFADFRIRHAARILRAGGVIAYPTEGVWGVGCDPDNEEAFAHLLALKQREPAKGVILIAASIAQVQPYLDGLRAAQIRQLEATWPGAFTWIVPDNGVAPLWVTGGRPGLALRVSAHPLVRALCEAFGGPIVSTSANPSGRPAAKTALRVRRYFPAGLDYVLKGPLGGQRGPTPIRDLVSGEVVRAS